MELFNNIIVPLDGSQSSAHAIPAAQLMADAADARLTLVRSFDSVPSWQADASRGRPRASLAAAEHDRIGAYLSGERLRLAHRGFRSPVQIEAYEGPAHEVIIGAANRDPNALITIATRARRGLSRFLHGSVASRVVSGVHNPTLMVRCDGAECPTLPRTIENIIVPLDGTPFSEHALQYAGGLATVLGARITLARCVSPAENLQVYAGWDGMGGVPALSDHDIDEMSDRLMSEAREYLWTAADHLAAKFPSVDVDATTVQQRATDAVVGLTQRLDNPMVLMATHGRRGLKRALLGSVADDVVRNSSAPTLLVKPGETG